ncbi:zinc-ribbon domain-containing protein [Roseomonas aerophila]|uniref:Zinc-ribbon domain-containing protein n=1 Tax=Teichococcus aerophilus TaxID=1224513 RepID=A0ABR7RN14_9PROT|nr:zinc-ribbon domain-containing protein [Pseudoroseomonas aerophila]MBC9207686.1 zinc-ribbon domain-containing protein [Pseudoroseomonas aerophila]
MAIAMGMRLECPACAAAYDVPDALLKPGQPVRCVRCHALWQPDTETTPDPAPPPPPPQPVLPPAPRAITPAQLQPGRPPAVSAPARSPRASLAAPVLAWAASLAVLVGAGAALVYHRAAVIEAWPPAAHLFLALGLH